MVPYPACSWGLSFFLSFSKNRPIYSQLPRSSSFSNLPSYNSTLGGTGEVLVMSFCEILSVLKKWNLPRAAVMNAVAKTFAHMVRSTM